MADPKPATKDDATTSPPQSTNRKARQRAPKACLSCRARKVRCDVSQNGTPCMNCRRDDEKCVVTKRNSRLCIVRVPSHQQEPEPRLRQLDGQSQVGSFSTELTAVTVPESLQIGTPVETEPHTSSWLRDLGKRETHVESRNSNSSRFKRDATRYNESHVGFHYYPFIDADGTSCLPLEDFQYLEQIGCFTLPIRSLLDEFMRVYFLHVHPHLPILDEGDIWTMYSDRGRSTDGPQKLSLFVMRALLVASCTYISSATLVELGFASRKDARATYYRQAKALFDMDTERSNLSTSQGSLLLTYHVPANNPNTNSLWLGIAIHFARDSGAHLYRTNQSTVHKTTLKRLWWSCLFRDRILSLGLRRPLQIRSQDFDANLDSLCEFDFEEEISKSRVYDPLAKRQLAQLTSALCELIGILTEINTFLYGTSSLKQGALTADVWESLNTWLHRLDQWHEKTYTSFLVMAVTQQTHEAIMLYTKVSCIYYYSAKAALHSRMILFSTREFGGSTSPEQGESSRSHLESVVGNITDSLNELSDHGLLQFVPISVVAYATLPLVWHVLSSKMRSDSSSSITTYNQTHLQICENAMKLFQTQYEGTDVVLRDVAKLFNWITVSDALLLQHHPSPESHKKTNSRGLVLGRDNNAMGLANISNRNQPRIYLRAAMAVDLMLSQGRFPSESELPSILQTVSTKPYLPMYNTVAGKHGREFGSVAGGFRLLDSGRSNVGVESRIEEERTPLGLETVDPALSTGHDVDMGNFENYFLAGMDYSELEGVLR